MNKAHARWTDPLASQEAARGLKPSVNDLEGVVLRALELHGPMTTHRIAEITGLTVVTVSPRIKPLRIKGMVADSGLRELRRSIWRVTSTEERSRFQDQSVQADSQSEAVQAMHATADTSK